MSDDESRPWALLNGPGELGNFVREMRLKADITQEQLADRLGVDRKYVYQIESGQGTLYALRLFALLRELDIELRAFAR